MKLQFCLVHHKQKGDTVAMHTHNALEMVYYVEGRGSSMMESTRHPISRNTFMLTPAGVFHDQVGETAVTSICLGMEGSDLEPRIGFYHDSAGLLRKVLEQLAAELDAKAPGFQHIADGLAMQAAGLAERIAAETHQPPVGDRIVDKALGIIQANAGALSVAELADQLYVSKDYLRHLFHEHSAASPIRHIIQTRIGKAKDLLANPALSIQEIAVQSGFDTVYYFSRTFKKETGMTPTQFRTEL